MEDLKSKAIETLPCIVCSKELQPVTDDINQPHAGTVFWTEGQYGSAAFDPMDGSFLEINICDECLTAAGKDGIVLYNKPVPRKIEPLTKYWEPSC